MDKSNRIFFKDNPYPNGHKIKEFVWSGRFEPETGLWFDFHLETEDYDAEDDTYIESEEIGKTNWTAKAGWLNFHSCTMSSTNWHFGGILVGNEENKLDFENLESQKITADELPLSKDFDDDDYSFYIYLLGHDSSANHTITFVKQHSSDIFDIEWNGKIALSYIGDYDFEYDFSASIEKVKFQGFSYDNEFTLKELNKFVVNSQQFEISDTLIKIKS